jgi:serine/threonine protein kinase
VAIKQIMDVFGVFENAKRIYREIKLLRILDHENIVKIVHIQMPRCAVCQRASLWVPTPGCLLHS